MRKIILPFALAVMVVLLVSCPSPDRSGTTPPRGGSLTINLPLIQMQPIGKGGADLAAVTSYDVFGAGPGSASFQKPGITDTSVTIDSLAPGNWGVTVNGNNSLKVVVRSTSVPVTIVEGETRSATVVTSQFVSNGTLDLSVTWPVSLGITSVTGSLTPLGGTTPQDITLPSAGSATINGVSATLQATTLIAGGYYTLAVVLKDAAGAAWGGAKAVLVTPGYTTTAQLAWLSRVLYMTIQPDQSKLVPFAFNDSELKPNYGLNTSITVNATPTVSKEFNTFSYEWYLNSARLAGETGSTVVISGQPKGDYRLDLVLTASGVSKTVLCSSHIAFTIAGGY